MDNNKFEYMLYSLWIYMGALLVVMITPIETYLFMNFSDTGYFALSLTTSFIVFWGYMKLTREMLVYEGTYSIINDRISIHLRRKKYEINISDIKEAICIERSYLGNRFVIFSIKGATNKIKLYSEILIGDKDVKDTAFYAIYNGIKRTNLFSEEDSILWLKRRNA